jgi:hypothetical protein
MILQHYHLCPHNFLLSEIIHHLYFDVDLSSILEEYCFFTLKIQHYYSLLFFNLFVYSFFIEVYFSIQPLLTAVNLFMIHQNYLIFYQQLMNWNKFMLVDIFFQLGLRLFQSQFNRYLHRLPEYLLRAHSHQYLILQNLLRFDFLIVINYFSLFNFLLLNLLLFLYIKDHYFVDYFPL